MSRATLDSVVQQLGSHRGRCAWWRPFARRAAVSIILRDSGDGLDALMIQRAERRGDRWSGHMAFPGGLVDPGDATPFAAALRETDEEVGLDLRHHGHYVTRLSDIVSLRQLGQRGRLVISPFVFTLEQAPPLRLNYEVADTIWVPLNYLADHSNRQYMPWPGGARPITVPYCMVEERRVWGMSLSMLDELIRALMLDRQRST